MREAAAFQMSTFPDASTVKTPSGSVISTRSARARSSAIASQLRHVDAQSRELEVRADARHELACRERLDQVVVGACFEPFDRALGPARAETSTIGTLLVRGSARRSRSSSKPSSRGIITSLRTRSGGDSPRSRQRLLAVGDRLDLPVPAQQPGRDRRACPRCRRRSGCVPSFVGVRGLAYEVVVGGARLRLRASGRASSGSQRSASSTYGAAPRLRAAVPSGPPSWSSRQVRAPARQPDREGRADAGRALHADGAAVQSGQLVDERESDAASFVAARRHVPDPVEALEEVRQLGCRHTDAAVSHLQHGIVVLDEAATTAISPAIVNLSAFERRLSTIFSHASRSTQIGSPSGGQSTSRRSPAASIAERKALARSVVTAARSVGWKSASIRPDSAREKSSSVFTRRSNLRAFRRISSRSFRRSAGCVRPGEQLLERRQDQRQRRPELVADIGEEEGLRPIELCECLAPLPFGLCSFGVGDPRRNLSRNELQEREIVVVDRAALVQAEHQSTDRRRRPLLKRQDRCAAHQASRGRTGPETFEDVLEQERFAARGNRGERPRALRGVTAQRDDLRRNPCSPALHIRRRSESRDRTVGLEQVGKRERHGHTAAQHACRACADIERRPRTAGRCRQLAQDPQASCADHMAGRLRNRCEHARDRTRLVPDRAVREGEVTLLGEAAPLEQKQLVLRPGRLAALADSGEHRSDDLPDLREAVERRAGRAQPDACLRSTAHTRRCRASRTRAPTRSGWESGTRGRCSARFAGSAAIPPPARPAWPPNRAPGSARPAGTAARPTRRRP